MIEQLYIRSLNINIYIKLKNAKGKNLNCQYKLKYNKYYLEILILLFNIMQKAHTPITKQQQILYTI